MGPALTHDNAFNRRATAHAGPALLMIHADVIVVVASLTPQVAVLVERCTSMLYAKGQHRNNPLVQSPHLVRCEGIGAAQGMNARVEEGFIRIDVAQAGNHML